MHLSLSPTRAAALGLALSLFPAVALCQTNVQAARAEVLAAFDVEAGTVQDLSLPDVAGPFQVEVVIAGQARVLTLHPYDVRSDSFQLFVQDETGIHPAPTPACVTYRGFILGQAESRVAASLVAGRLEALVRLERGDSVWSIQSLAPVVNGAPASRHIVFESADNSPLDTSCGVPDFVTHSDPQAPGIQLGSAGNLKVCEIACDADVQFYTLNGSSVVQTQNDIAQIINGTQTIYLAEVGILYEITTIIVRTAEPDPYTSSNPGTLLNQFRSHWNSSQTSVHRDVAHLFTGRDLNGSVIGVAWLGVICHGSMGYGLSQSRFSGNLTQRVGLTAHELGHNWNAAHCNGAGDCMIMCSGLGGCAGLGGFGSASTNSILNHKASRPCLHDPVPPTLGAISPGSAQIFGTQPVTVTGSDLSGVNSMDVGVETLSSALGQFTIVDDSTITFVPPVQPALGAAGVTASNLTGTSNALSVNYTITNPPRLTSGGTIIGGNPYYWQFGADPDDLWFLFVSVNDPTTAPFMGFDILTGSFFLGLSGTLNVAGFANSTVVAPTGAAAGTQVFSQVLLLSDGTSTFAGATNVTLGQFFL